MLKTRLEELDFQKRGGLIPTVIQDANTGEVLGIAYSNEQSVEKAIEIKEGVYWSTSRKEIWHKGETSGNIQKLVEILYDCDGDALLKSVKKGACLIKPNRFELSRALGCRARSRAKVIALGRKLIRLGAKNAVISDGEGETIGVTECGVFSVRPPSVKVRSTIGAGDSMVAGMLCALSDGCTMENALCFGTAVASAQVMTSGTDLFSPTAAKRLLHKVELKRL